MTLNGIKSSLSNFGKKVKDTGKKIKDKAVDTGSKVKKWFNKQSRKIKAVVTTTLITLASMLGVVLFYEAGPVGPPAGNGNLNWTDQGSYWQIDMIDEDGSVIRFTPLETFDEYTPNGDLSWDNSNKYSFNVTNSSTNQVWEIATIQFRGISNLDQAGENMTVMESSDELLIVRWDVEWEGTDVNVSGNLYMAYVNRIAWHPIGIHVTIDEGSDSSNDLFVEMNANGGLFAGGTTSNYADQHTDQDTTYYQCEDDNRDPGQVMAVWDTQASTGHVTDNHTWDNEASQNRRNKVYKFDGKATSTNDVIKGVMFYKVIQGYTTWTGGKQFDNTYDLNDTTTAVTGTFKGMNTHYGFYEYEASARTARFTFDGNDATTYTPMMMVTGLSGNLSDYALFNGSTEMTLGTDYWAHWNGTNGVMYIWWKDMGGTSQTYTLKEPFPGGDLSWNSGTNQIDWYGEEGTAWRTTIDSTPNEGDQCDLTNTNAALWNTTGTDTLMHERFHLYTGVNYVPDIARNYDTFEVLQNSTEMWQCSWNFEQLDSDNYNVTGPVIITIYNHLPFMFLGYNRTIYDHASAVTYSWRPMYYSFNGYWDDDGTNGNDDVLSLSNNAAYVWDSITSATRGAVFGCWGYDSPSDSSLGWGNGYKWKQIARSTTATTHSNQHPHDSPGSDGSFFGTYWLCGRMETPADCNINEQFLKNATIDNTLNGSTANKGTWLGWNYLYAAYEIDSDSNNKANITFNGNAEANPYMPTIKVNMDSAITGVTVYNGSTELLDGYDYAAHVNSTIAYVWFTNMNDQTQYIEIQGATEGGGPANNLNITVTDNRTATVLYGVNVTAYNSTWTETKWTDSSGNANFTDVGDDTYTIEVGVDGANISGNLLAAHDQWYSNTTTGYSVSGDQELTIPLIEAMTYYYHQDQLTDYNWRQYSLTYHQEQRYWNPSDNVTGFMWRTFYTIPYFRSTLLVFSYWGNSSHTSNTVYAARDFLKELATQCDEEGYEIYLAVGDDPSRGYYFPDMEYCLNYIGDHESIKFIGHWNEYSDNFYQDHDRDDEIYYLNNFTSTALNYTSETAGDFQTVAPGGDSSANDKDYHWHYHHTNYPQSGHQGVLTWHDAYSPGAFATGGGLWDDNYVYNEINVSAFFEEAANNNEATTHIITFGQYNYMVIDNMTIRGWIYKYATNSTYQSDYPLKNRVLDSYDTTNKTWVNYNGTFVNLDETTQHVNITVSGTTGQNGWVRFFVPADKPVYDNCTINGTVEDWSGNYTWPNGDKLYNKSFTFGSDTWVMLGEPAGTSLTVNSPSDQTNEWHDDPMTIGWIVTDNESSSGDYTVYKNITWFSSGTWTNNTAINVDIKTLDEGVWNMTIDATDAEYNATDTVYITIENGSIRLWIEGMKQSDDAWGPRNLTYDVLGDDWESEGTNAYSTAYAVAALKSMSSDDILDETDVETTIKGWQSTQFQSGLIDAYRFWEQYWCVWALDLLGTTPTTPSSVVDWINGEQTVGTNEAYWILEGNERPYTTTEAKFEQTFASVMAILTIDGTDTSNVSNWAKVKTWLDNRQNSDGGWDATNKSESRTDYGEAPRSGYGYGNESIIPYSWMAAEIYNAAGISIPDNSSLATWVKQVQSDDGGWGYWSGDNSTNMMCTYAALRILDLLGETPYDASGAYTFIKSCEGYSTGFSWRPELLEILEATFYGVESIKLLDEFIPRNGTTPSWEPTVPTPSDNVNIYEYQVETYGMNSGMGNDPSGAIVEAYNQWGYDLIAPKQSSDTRINEANGYADNHNIEMEVYKAYEDYGANPWIPGIPEKYTHCHDWFVPAGQSPTSGQDYPLETHITSMVDSVKSAGGLGGFYQPTHYAMDGIWMDLNWKTDLYETGQFMIIAGHYWVNPWFTGSNPGIGILSERWFNNRSNFPNADAHKSVWRDGDTHALEWRSFFIAPNNTIEGLEYAIERGWTATIRANAGSNYASKYHTWDPSYVEMWGYEDIVDWLVDNQTQWQWWGDNYPIDNILVYPLSNGTKNYYDYDQKSSDESSTWNSARDGALFRVYYHSPSDWTTIDWISLGTEKWTKNITPTNYTAIWTNDDADYADYQWFEDTSLAMGVWNVSVGYTNSDGSHTYTRTFNIGTVPAPYVRVDNVANRTIENTVVIDLEIDVGGGGSVQSCQYKWDSGSYTSLSSPYDITVSGLSTGGHKLTVRVSDGNYTEEYEFWYYRDSSPTLSGFWVGNKTTWDNDKMSRWFDIYPHFPPNDGNVTIYALMQGQSAPSLIFEKRYAQYSDIFETNETSFISMGTYDSYFTLWNATIQVAPGMNVTYWIMYDDDSNSSSKWFKATPDPFQDYYGLGILSSWGEDDWSISTLMDNLDEVSASLIIPINTWGQTSTEKYYIPFDNSTWLYPIEEGSYDYSTQNIDDWITQLNTRDPNRTNYAMSWFFYYRTFRDEAALEVGGPRTSAEWEVFIDKYAATMASEPSLFSFVLDQEYADYHRVEELYPLYIEWDDDSDGILESTEWEQHMVDEFVYAFRDMKFINYGGQPHLGYRWSSHVLPDNVHLEGSVNHFQHADADGGTSEQYFRQIDYADAGYISGSNLWTPGLFTMGVSPSADDLATDYKMHWTNETHQTSTEWSDFGFADQIPYALMLNPHYVTIWVQGKWDDITEPYAFDADEKAFANKSAKLMKTVPYIQNLTYMYRPSGNNLTDLSYDEEGTKPSWLTANASASEGVFYSIMKETGSMYQIVAINLQTTEKVLNVTLGSGLFTEYGGVSKLVAFNASDGSNWTKLNNTAGQRDFQITLANNSFQIFKFGIPFEVLGLPFDYEGWNWTSYDHYPSVSSMTVNEFDWNDLNVTVASPTDQFFKFYTESGSWTLEINGGFYDGDNTIDTDSVPAKLGLISGGAEQENQDPQVNSPSDQEWEEGTTGHELDWIVTDTDDGSGDYTVYKNGTYHGAGTWIDNNELNYDIDGTLEGYWNFSISATDGGGGQNATDTIWVNVTESTNINPSVTSPADQEWVNGTLGHEIDWNVTDPEQSSGSYTVYKNGTYYNASTWTNNTELNLSIDDLGYGYWNMTITASDGIGTNTTDTVWIDVTANLTFTPSLNPPDVTSMNVTGNIEDFPVNLTPTGQTDTYAIYKIDFQDGADYQYGIIEMNFSAIPSGVIFYIDDDNDFSSATSWNTTDATTAKEVITSTGMSDPDYLWMKIYMPVGQGGFSWTTYFWSREDD